MFGKQMSGADVATSTHSRRQLFNRLGDGSADLIHPSSFHHPVENLTHISAGELVSVPHNPRH